MSKGPNPYELGVQHAKELKPVPLKDRDYTSRNPYPEFSSKWSLYNQGYNQTLLPHVFPKDKS